MIAVPTFDAYLGPIVQSLKAHGGSMTNREMADNVAASMGLPDEVQAVMHGQSAYTEVEYRMAWARTYLKKAGLLESSARGVWRLTPAGAAASPEELAKVPRRVRQMGPAPRQRADLASRRQTVDVLADPEVGSWRYTLLELLLKLQPDAFERLCQRALRESGFTKVEVTGRTGDGGIDGTGVLRVNLLSFQVIFQCKRYRGSVGAPVVRDFRGAMVGRADKGLIITTGSFTLDARKEAVRDGAPAIDLVDGEALCDLLKALGIGVAVRMVEEVTVDERAFRDL